MTPEQKVLFDALTGLQQRVCVAILSGVYDSNRAAYYAAKGKAKNDESADATVSRILSETKVRAFMDNIKDSIVSDAIMSREEALERLTKMARVTITDIAEFREDVIGEDDKGNPLMATNWRIKNSDEISPEAAASIKSVTSTKMGPKLEMHDPMGAMQQLAKMQGWDAATKVDNTLRVIDDGSNEW